MSFTGLLYKKSYFTKFIFVYKYEEGAYDYFRGNEEICGFHKETTLIKVCLTSSRAKEVLKIYRSIQ